MNKKPISQEAGPIESSPRGAVGGGPSKTHADLMIASAEAPLRWKQVADHVSTGSNDHTLIRTAANSLPNGGLIWLSPGRFYLTGYLELAAGITLAGTSIGAPTAGGAWGSSADDVRHGTVLVMSKAADLYGIGHNGLRNLGMYYFHTGNQDDRVPSFEIGEYARMENIHVKGGWTEISSYSVVTGCKFEYAPNRNQNVLDVWGRWIRVTNNHIRVRSDSGQYAEGTGIKIRYANNIISGNQIETQEYGIWNQATDTVISNNVITYGVNPVSSGVIGIFNGNVTGTVVVGNNVYAPGHKGADFYPFGSGGNVCVGNSFTGATPLVTGHASNVMAANRLTVA